MRWIAGSGLLACWGLMVGGKIYLVDVMKDIILHSNHTGMIYYHGTSNDSITDKILPPSNTGCISEVGRKKNLDKVFFTTSYKSALIYAKRAANVYGGNPRVLCVEPIGTVICLNSNKGTEVYYSDYCNVISTHIPGRNRQRTV